MIDPDAVRTRWFPIAESRDLHFRHVYQAQLLGRELAVWRADDDNVNAWENRCLHRGVRLSIGINDGTELVCQYHGWRYANRTAGCTYIPAHPADAPARTICNTTYPIIERFGLIWSKGSSERSEEEPNLPPMSEKITPLRSIAVNASADSLLSGLLEFFETPQISNTVTNTEYSVEPLGEFSVRLRIADTSAILFLQPADSNRTIIRGLLEDIDVNSHSSTAVRHLLKTFSFVLGDCRDSIEAEVEDQDLPRPWIPIIAQVSESIAKIPEKTNSSNKTGMRMKVVDIQSMGPSVKSYRFEPIEGSLPTAQPGAHIDVQLPNGLTRQYSLINGPGQTDHYAIAVKRLSDSSGGSKALHENLKVGDLIATSTPRNNFSLRRDAEHTILVAGGIGITPLLSMARAMHHVGLAFTLHYFVNHKDDIVFRDELESMDSKVSIHIGYTATETGDLLGEILHQPQQYHHVYLCGPGPMLSAARGIAAEQGWSDDAIHFEYFKNSNELTDSTQFTVELARSGLTLDVPPGKSLLEVLQENHVAVASSCEQGACGTCRVSVLDGQPDHQDVYLSNSEKSRGDCMMSCVSRAHSDKLILDL